jgi:hypothetical protein
MGHRAKATRHNRTITVDFRDESTYLALQPLSPLCRARHDGDSTKQLADSLYKTPL